MANRYVNYDKLLEKRKGLGLDEMSMIHKVNALNLFIDNLPTADVVEVVRCPECIYCENMKCTELRDNSGHPLDVAIFDYCSQGVRK